MKRFFVAAVGFALTIGFSGPLFAAPQPESSAIVFVVDTSGSMKGAKLVAAKKAVTSLSSVIPADVRVGLISFGTSPQVRVSPIFDRAPLVRETNALVAQGNTSLYDAIGMAYTELTAVPKGFVVVISDGEDTASSLTTAKLRFRDWTNIELHVIGVDFATFTDFKRKLKPLVQQTGGVLTSVDNSALIEKALLRTLAKAGVVPKQPEEEPLLVNAPILAPNSPLRFVLAFFVGVGTFSLLMAGVVAIRRRQIHRMRKYLRDSFFVEMEHDKEESDEGQSRLASWLRLERLTHNLDRAGLRFPALQVRQAQLLVALLIFVIASSISFPAWLAAIFAVIVPIMGLRRFLSRAIDRRQAAFNAQLPDFLAVAASTLRSGLPVIQAVESATKDPDSELSQQMSRVVQEMSLGTTFEGAMRKVADRMDSPDFSWLVTAIEIQRSVGGNLSEILDIAADSVRTRIQLQQEIKTLASEGILSARVLTALPLGLLGFLVLSRREFVAPLWETPLGVLLLGLALLLMYLGYAWIRRLSKLEV